MRYHPAVVAQKAATIQLLSDGRFTLGLGAGENLNEHVVGGDWPPVDVRHDMLDEALEIIRPLLAGETVTFRGTHLEAETAKLWDLPADGAPIGVAVSGPRVLRARRRARRRDDRGRAEARARRAVRRRRRHRQASHRPGRASATTPTRAPPASAPYEQFRWFTGGWTVHGRAARPEALRRRVEPRDARTTSPSRCRAAPTSTRHVEAVKKFVDAGLHPRRRRPDRRRPPGRVLRLGRGRAAPGPPRARLTTAVRRCEAGSGPAASRARPCRRSGWPPPRSVARSGG